MHYKVNEQRKAFKKDISKELIPVAWHPTRWSNWCFPGHAFSAHRQYMILGYRHILGLGI